ncbi:MAG: hypothetical protein KF836_07395 [Fimbriimonadaceae bacterium]|nr:hypothetical protein [Fimbriimonadaceae bacterium]
MALVWKPHEFHLWKLVPEVVEGRVIKSEWVWDSTFSGLLVEKAAHEVRDLTDIESQNLAVVLMELEDSEAVELGDQLVLDAWKYRVLVDPIRFSIDLPTDHAKVVVERLDS